MILRWTFSKYKWEEFLYMLWGFMILQVSAVTDTDEAITCMTFIHSWMSISQIVGLDTIVIFIGLFTCLTSPFVTSICEEISWFLLISQFASYSSLVFLWLFPSGFDAFLNYTNLIIILATMFPFPLSHCYCCCFSATITERRKQTICLIFTFEAVF